jgi:glycosyltransferase involved in cell wall biosynthesis
MTTKIKVLQCIRQGQIGGGESHLLSLVENLDKSRFEPAVLSFTEGPMIDRLKEMNVPTHVIHTTRPFDFGKWKEVKHFIAETAPDIVHAHGTRANSNVLWAAHSLKIPVIYTVHGWSFHQDQRPLVRRIRIMGEKYLTKRSDLNISVSSSNQQSGQKYIPSFKSIVINNGIDQAKFNPQAAYKDIRTELNIPATDTLIVFVARFTSHKQPLSLIEAFSRALPSHPDMHLLMVGDGDQKEMAIDMIARAGIQHKVTLQSFRQDVPAVLASSDIFVLPSLWEGLPIGLLEALAMGKPVIATKVDGTSEIIEHNVNGMLIDTNNLVDNLTRSLVKLGKDAALRATFSQKAIETVRNKYNAGKMTREIENIYSEFINKKQNQLNGKKWNLRELQISNG